MNHDSPLAQCHEGGYDCPMNKNEFDAMIADLPCDADLIDDLIIDLITDLDAPAIESLESDIADKIRIAMKSLDADNLAELRIAYEICPIHLNDLDICIDDNLPECAELRASLDS